MRSPIVAIVALLALGGCEERIPLNQSMAVSIADHYQRYNTVNWGDPSEILPPATPDSEGRRWWQMRYRSESTADRRMILVDDATGWARFPSAEYVERVAPLSRPSAEHPVQVQEGTWVLRITPSSVVDARQRTDLEREAIRLNALAGQTGLVPLFSVHQYANQNSSIIYGWQVDKGIAQDPRIVDWVQRRTRYADTVNWENLSQP